MKETYEQLIARVNASAYLPPLTEADKKSKLPAKARRIVDGLDAGQRARMHMLLTGRAALATVGGRSYVLWREGDAWRCAFAGPNSRVHTLRAGACSCEDCRLRGKRCKHLVALETLEFPT